MNVAGMINDRLNAPFTGPLLSDMTATADGAGEGRSHLTAKEIQDMESILRDGMVGYAYLYPHGEEFPQVYVFSMTPENIATEGCFRLIRPLRENLVCTIHFLQFGRPLTPCLRCRVRDRRDFFELLDKFLFGQFRHITSPLSYPTGPVYTLPGSPAHLHSGAALSEQAEAGS